MPVTLTQDVYKIRSLDNVHINPSILEGTKAYPSILGPNRAIEITRFAPTFIVQPSIGGSFKIPSVLTCNPGVIESSPSPDLFYQWKADGVAIPGETNKTLTTNLSFDENVITCEVTAVNFLGTAIGESSGITAQIVEPVINQEYGLYAVTGMDQYTQHNLMSSLVYASSGWSATTRSDIVSKAGMVVTGWAASGRLDNLQGGATVTTGTSAPARNDLLSTLAFGVTGIAQTTTSTVFENEAYVMWQPTYYGDLAIINPSGDTGDMTGWTTVSDNIVGITAANTSLNVNTNDTTSVDPNYGMENGPWFFTGRLSTAITAGSGASMHQTMDIDSGLLSDIDAGGGYFSLRYMQDTYTPSFGHQLECTITLLDAADNVTGTHVENHYQQQGAWWRPVITDLLNIPPTTRKIRLNFEFFRENYWALQVHLDEIRVSLYTDVR